MTSECPNEHFCLAPSLEARLRLLQIKRKPVNRNVPVTEVSGTSTRRKLSFVRSPEPVNLHDTETKINVDNAPLDFKTSYRKLLKIEPVSSYALNGKNAMPVEDYNNRVKRDTLGNYEDEIEMEDGHTHQDSEVLPNNDVLFLGAPASLFQSVTVTSYSPRFSFISLGWVEFLQDFCLTFVKLSGALGLLNMVPCFGFDGQYITDTLVEWCATGHLSKRKIRLVKFSIMAAGTTLLAANIIVGGLSLHSSS